MSRRKIRLKNPRGQRLEGEVGGEEGVAAGLGLICGTGSIANTRHTLPGDKQEVADAEHPSPATKTSRESFSSV